MLTIRFSAAIVATHEIHVSQLRKGTTIPYIAHLLGFTSIALQHGAGEDEAIAALLHDSIEDAPDHLGAAGVRRLLRERFGERVLCIVEACTDTDVRPKPEWRVRKDTYVLHLQNVRRRLGQARWFVANSRSGVSSLAAEESSSEATQCLFLSAPVCGLIEFIIEASEE